MIVSLGGDCWFTILMETQLTSQTATRRIKRRLGQSDLRVLGNTHAQRQRRVPTRRISDRVYDCLIDTCFAHQGIESAHYCSREES